MAEVEHKRSRKGLWLLIFILCVGFALFKVFGPNTGALSKGEYLYIRTGSDYDDLIRNLHEGGYIRDMTSFNFIARRLSLPARIHPGKYKIARGMSNYRIIRLLRSGRQTPVKLVIHKLRTKK